MNLTSLEKRQAVRIEQLKGENERMRNWQRGAIPLLEYGADRLADLEKAGKEVWESIPSVWEPSDHPEVVRHTEALVALKVALEAETVLPPMGVAFTFEKEIVSREEHAELESSLAEAREEIERLRDLLSFFKDVRLIEADDSVSLEIQHDWIWKVQTSLKESEDGQSNRD